MFDVADVQIALGVTAGGTDWVSTAGRSANVTAGAG